MRQNQGDVLRRFARQLAPPVKVDDPTAAARLRSGLNPILVRHSAHRAGAGTAGAAGLKVLVRGASGTGKTLAAQLLARELGHDLFLVDLAQVVSKYIGETEKNIERLFAAAAAARAVLLFDEADALFGQRTEIAGGHDRYGKLEIGRLLLQMDSFVGMCVLATTGTPAIDDALRHRFDCVIDLPSSTPKPR